MDFKVLIIGGGMGGLCLAQGLKKAGIEFELFERDKHKADRLQGYRISINSDGATALQECLTAEHFEKFMNTCGQLDNSKPNTICLLTSQMSELAKFDAPSNERSYPASRITLRKLLLEGIESKIQFSKTFTHYAVSTDNRTVTAYFEDGTTAEGNLLVAADGSKSRVRQQMLPHAQRIDTGNISVAAKIPLTPEIKSSVPEFLFTGPAIIVEDGWSMFIALHLSPRIALDPQISENKASLWFDNNAPYILLAIGSNKKNFSENALTMTKEQLFIEAQYRVSSWHPYLQSIVASADPDTINSFNISTSTPVDPWDSGIVTFLGDAIHSMTPYRGNGGNQALKDAENLCKTIVGVVKDSKGELVPAIHEYEGEMLKRGFKWVGISLQTMRMAHEEGWKSTARNFGLRAMNLMMHPRRVLFGEAS